MRSLPIVLRREEHRLLAEGDDPEPVLMTDGAHAGTSNGPQK